MHRPAPEDPLPIDSSASLIRLRPRADRVYIGRSRTLLVTDPSGAIVDDEHGLWMHETRVLSRLRWLVDGATPIPAGGSPVAIDRWEGYAIVLPPRPGAAAKANPSQGPIELHLARTLEDGMREDVALTNHTQRRTRVVLALELEADFAAPQEQTGPRRQRGRLRRSWSADDRTLRFDYAARHRFHHGTDRGTAELRRGLLITVEHADSPVAYRRRSLVFVVSLSPHAKWRARLGYAPVMDGETRVSSPRARTPEPLAEMPRFEGPSEASLATVVLAAVERAERDLSGLRLRDLDGARGAWTFAGGLPTYQTFFGRDALQASRAGAMLGPEILEGALRVLALTQARWGTTGATSNRGGWSRSSTRTRWPRSATSRTAATTATSAPRSSIRSCSRRSSGGPAARRSSALKSSRPSPRSRGQTASAWERTGSIVTRRARVRGRRTRGGRTRATRSSGPTDRRCRIRSARARCKPSPTAPSARSRRCLRCSGGTRRHRACAGRQRR